MTYSSREETEGKCPSGNNGGPFCPLGDAVSNKHRYIEQQYSDKMNVFDYFTYLVFLSIKSNMGNQNTLLLINTKKTQKTNQKKRKWNKDRKPKTVIVIMFKSCQ